MRRLKNPNQWPPGGWNFEEPSTGFRFKGSSLQDLAANARFVRITNAGLRESHVHDVSITRAAPNYPVGG